MPVGVSPVTIRAVRITVGAVRGRGVACDATGRLRLALESHCIMFSHQQLSQRLVSLSLLPLNSACLPGALSKIELR